ncbi:acid protease [Mollisia scopiformis]|uniref:Acid protease n=1 Tax=Mollisia scopiformis TaxID=149040 RepID=A0A194XB62_MOLSC|nr:acid protease [Mollisia scopiformis]KUJ17384.1 acid protease [Mollisia scopiformis]
MLSSTASLYAFLSLSSALTITTRGNAGYYYMPVEFDYDPDSRVTAELTFGSADKEPIQVVMDTGSSDAWIWSPNGTIHWGSNYLGAVGPCNASVPTPYNPSLSSTAIVYDHNSTYAYAGNAKIVSGAQYVNDTLTATNGSPIPNVQIAMENYGTLRQLDDGSCKIPEFDRGIIGLAPYTNTTSGPAFRQNLFDAGLIATRTMTMWFDHTTTSLSKLVGGVIFGGIDTSKYTGELIQVPNVIADYQIGIYIPKPNVTINGQTFVPDQNTTCLLDSGAHADYIPFDYLSNMTSQFLAASNGTLIQYAGVIGFNGSCENIPSDLNITYTFPGVEEGKSVSIDVPIKNYARGLQTPPDADMGDICLFNLESGGCQFGAPFLSGAFMGLDDEGAEIWLAQGAVSAEGQGVSGSLKVFEAGEGFGSL